MAGSLTDAALIAVDLQNGFLSAHGSFARLGFDIRPLGPAADQAVRVVQAFCRQRLPVFLTALEYDADYDNAGLLGTEIDPRLRPARALVAGSWDAALIDALPSQGVTVVKKHRYSAFLGTGLEQALRQLAVRQVVVVGVTTSVCVESTARDAMQRDFSTIVVSDATAEFEPARHAASLAVLGAVFGRIATSAEILDGLGGGP
jgi:ureidoacrylate peracid hydrolase